MSYYINSHLNQKMLNSPKVFISKSMEKLLDEIDMLMNHYETIRFNPDNKYYRKPSNEETRNILKKVNEIEKIYNIEFAKFNQKYIHYWNLNQYYS